MLIGIMRMKNYDTYTYSNPFDFFCHNRKAKLAKIATFHFENIKIYFDGIPKSSPAIKSNTDDYDQCYDLVILMLNCFDCAILLLFNPVIQK